MRQTPPERQNEEKVRPSLRKRKTVKEKIVKQEILRRAVRIVGVSISTAMLAGLLNLPSVQAQDTAAGTTAIPGGTILPVRLNSSLSSAKAQPGQIITARIMQDVPLANGGKIHEGSKVIGHVVDVSSPADTNKEQISVQFDKLVSSGRTIPIRTDLRAVAGFVAVFEAETRTDGTNSQPIATTLVGGDAAYTGGDVTTRDGAVVGKSVNGGALEQVSAASRQGKDCRGVVDGNNSPEAMWVFSSDACGTYGLSEIRVAHAGKTQPVGVIVLVSEKGQLKLPSGAGMLLRVQ
jgi:hypothetical protein